MKKQLLFIALSALSSLAIAQLQAPVLTVPADSAVRVHTTADFDWNPALGGTPLGYEFQLATDTAFNNLWATSVTGSSGKGIKMLFNTRYYWRVRAIGTSGNSPWSNRFTFTTQFNNFNLTSPFNLEEINAVRATLQWSHLTNLNYQVQFDTSANFNSSALGQVTVINPEVKSNRVTRVVEDLIYNSTYKWRIRGFHSNDTSGWSVPSNFITAASIGQLTIGDGASGIFIDTSLSARSIQGTDSYELQMDTSAVINPSSKEYIHQINSKPEFEVDQLLFGKTYYWEVRGINASNNSPWSGVWSFTTLDKVTTTFPQEDDETSQIPLFEWEGMPGIETFQIEVADNDMFNDPEHADIIGELMEYSFPNELGFGTFYWRVRAISTRDTTKWSDPVSFKTRPVGINELKNNIIASTFPNPVGNELNLVIEKVSNPRIEVSLSDLTGKVVFETVIMNSGNGAVSTLLLPDLTNGVYLLQATTGDSILREKLIINK